MDVRRWGDQRWCLLRASAPWYTSDKRGCSSAPRRTCLASRLGPAGVQWCGPVLGGPCCRGAMRGHQASEYLEGRAVPQCHAVGPAGGDTAPYLSRRDEDVVGVGLVVVCFVALVWQATMQATMQVWQARRRCGNGLMLTGQLLRHCDFGWHGWRGNFRVEIRGHSGKGISRVGLPWPILHREVKLGELGSPSLLKGTQGGSSEMDQGVVVCEDIELGAQEVVTKLLCDCPFKGQEFQLHAGVVGLVLLCWTQPSTCVGQDPSLPILLLRKDSAQPVMAGVCHCWRR